MPINPTTLKELIDTQITNETVDFAITPTEVGGRMKDTIDYTTEQVALISQSAKVIKRTLTHSELLNIFTNPIVILPATVGKMYVPKDILIKYINNDGWGSASNWRLLLDTLQLANFISQMAGGTVNEQFSYLLQGTPSNTATSFFNKDVIITATANPTAPVNETTTVDVYITYFEIII
jgi:hypothetical protein